jgi:hypothetical protein
LGVALLLPPQKELLESRQFLQFPLHVGVEKRLAYLSVQHRNAYVNQPQALGSEQDIIEPLAGEVRWPL